MRVVTCFLFALVVSLGLMGCGSSHHGGGGGAPPPPPPVNTLSITSPTTLTAGTHGQAYAFQLEASGGATPYTWSNLSALPPGLTLFGGGAIQGTPTTAGSFNFQAQVQDVTTPNKQTIMTTFTLVIQ